MTTWIRALKPNRRFAKILAGTVLTLLILAGLSAWLVPKAIHHVLTQNVAQLLGRQVDVGQIRFNPFTLALSAQDLTIEQPQSPPLLRVGQIDLRVAWRSIVLFAPVLDRVHIERPQIALVRQDATHYNFSDILQRLDEASAQEPAPAKPDAGLPRFSLNNLSLTNGTISLDDHVTGRHQVVDDLTLSLPFLSTLSYATKIDVQPAVHMRINGSPFDLTGTARPFDTVPASTLNVTLDGLALSSWADFWPLSLPVQLKSALLDSSLRVLFEQPADAAPRIRVQGDAGLRQLDVAESSGAPLLRWDSLKVSGLNVDLAAHTVSIGTVALDKPQVEAHQDVHELNWQRVANGFAKLGAPESAKPADATKPEVAKPDGTAPKAATAQTATGNTAVAANAATHGPATTAAPAAPAWKVAIDTFKLDAAQVHLRDDPIKLDHTVSGLGAEVQHITLPQAADQPMLVSLDMNDPASGGTLKLQAPVILQPLSIQASIQADKLALAPFAATIRHFAPLALQTGLLSLAGKVDIAGSRIEAREVKLGLQQLTARDESSKPAVNLSVGSLALEADRLALDDKATHFTLRADGIQKHGTMALKGSLTTQPLSLKTSVDLAKFDAATLAPYFASRLNATVRSLSVGARGDAEFVPPAGKTLMRAKWQGAAQINNLDLRDRVNKAEFLNWKHLELSHMQVSMDGPKLRLGLGNILLRDFYGNILLNNQAQLNVTDILVEKGRAAGSITQDTQTRRAQSANKRPAARGRAGPEPDISINSVKLQRGRVTFNDHFVRPNYRAELSSIAGTLTAVSSSRPTPAKVDVTGRVYGTAPLSISGTVQPFARYLALDLEATARGVDLPRFTTYSSKYVGYAIERGKLSVDLHYQIKDRALQATNKVLLNQLTFGKPSGSPDAIKLPVLLAVSLLKDSSGNIDINLPIAGSLDDPQFSVGGIVIKVILNTLAKAVTAPFKLLASAFGGGSEDLSQVSFAAGSAALDDSAKSGIATLVKALSDRPALKMDVIGRADPQADRAALHGDKPRPRTAPKALATQATAPTSPGAQPASAAPPVPPLSAADKQALTRLAEARAQAVYEQIMTSDQKLIDRVFIVAPKIDADSQGDGSGGGPATRVDFALH